VRRKVKIGWRRIFAGIVACWFASGCGEDLEIGGKKEGNLRIGKSDATLHFGAQSGGGKSGSRPVENTTVQGNLFNLRPATTRPLVVFVFVNLKDPGSFQDFRDAEVALVRDDRSFIVPHLAAGDLTVVFLLDQAGVNQDGTIDQGDPIAIFQDATNRLHNLSAETDVILQDVDVSFNLTTSDAGIATVQSEGNIIIAQQCASNDNCSAS
jgi:hypothetical protein